MLQKFFKGEHGSTVIDWIVVVSGVLVLSLAAMVLMSEGALQLTRATSSVLIAEGLPNNSQDEADEYAEFNFTDYVPISIGNQANLETYRNNLRSFATAALLEELASVEARATDPSIAANNRAWATDQYAAVYAEGQRRGLDMTENPHPLAIQTNSINQNTA